MPEHKNTGADKHLDRDDYMRKLFDIRTLIALAGVVWAISTTVRDRVVDEAQLAVRVEALEIAVKEHVNNPAIHESGENKLRRIRNEVEPLGTKLDEHTKQLSELNRKVSRVEVLLERQNGHGGDR